MAANAPSELLWDVVRKNNCHMVKRDGVTFSRERHNLRNQHSYKYSGFVQPKTVGVVQEKVPGSASDKKHPQLVTSVTKNATNPKKVEQRTSLCHGHARAHKAINRFTYSGHFRPDLRKDALARYSAYARSLQTRSRGVANRRHQKK
eukprot:gb/GECG01011736.1/.p1 GENE.gb/GECG01011736.1/~~gb/GECG01011736.1/.p1  ORF type:complete len:147 (+),score=13.97 gb/GECG01011736.1/:1-441(+)